MSDHVRELSFGERARWGECPVCGAKEGEPCHADVGLQIGSHIDGSRLRTGEGAHLERLNRAPRRVREVPV